MLRVNTRPFPAQLFIGSRPNHRIGSVQNNNHRTKPVGGGLWTADLRAGGSAWADYAAGDFGLRYDHSAAWKLRPQPSARVFVLDSLRDLRYLQTQHPRFPETEFADGFVLPIVDSWIPALDWPGIAADFDAVRLSDRGFRVLGGGGPLLDWSVPSTVWMRWSFVGEPERVHRPHEQLSGKHREF